jgi:TonB family protein
MVLRIRPAATFVLLALTTGALAAAQNPGSIFLARQDTPDGSYRWEILASRVSSLPQWNPRVDAPPLSLDAAIKIGEEWLKQQTPEIKAFDVSFVSLARFPIQDLWYYRLQFDPVVANRRLSAGANPFTVVVLLDGSVVEPRVETVSSPSRGAGLGGPLGPGSGTGAGTGPRSAAESLPVPDASGVYRVGPGITMPVAITIPIPKYTPDAMAARIQGTVMIECVVQTDGRCSDVRLVRSLDSKYGLDEEALTVAKEYRFRPGLRLGVPVPVRVTIEVSFSVSAKP